MCPILAQTQSWVGASRTRSALACGVSIAGGHAETGTVSFLLAAVIQRAAARRCDPAAASHLAGGAAPLNFSTQGRRRIKLRRLERIAAAAQYRLRSEAAHYYPAGGFNPLFDQMLDGFDVRYGTAVRRIEAQGRPSVITDRGSFDADLVVTTAPIDALLGYRHGALECRGCRIKWERVEALAEARLGRAPDGVPFAWLYTAWAKTPVCRTTDFGVIHQGPRPAVTRRIRPGQHQQRPA